MTKNPRARALIVGVGPGIIIFLLLHLASIVPIQKLNCWVATNIATSDPPICSGSVVATPTFFAFFGVYAVLAIVLVFFLIPSAKKGSDVPAHN